MIKIKERNELLLHEKYKGGDIIFKEIGKTILDGCATALCIAVITVIIMGCMETFILCAHKTSKYKHVPGSEWHGTFNKLFLDGEEVERKTFHYHYNMAAYAGAKYLVPRIVGILIVLFILGSIAGRFIEITNI